MCPWKSLGNQKANFYVQCLLRIFSWEVEAKARSGGVRKKIVHILGRINRCEVISSLNSTSLSGHWIRILYQDFPWLFHSFSLPYTHDPLWKEDFELRENPRLRSDFFLELIRLLYEFVLWSQPSFSMTLSFSMSLGSLFLGAFLTDRNKGKIR